VYVPPNVPSISTGLQVGSVAEAMQYPDTHCSVEHPLLVVMEVYSALLALKAVFIWSLHQLLLMHVVPSALMSAFGLLIQSAVEMHVLLYMTVPGLQTKAQQVVPVGLSVPDALMPLLRPSGIIVSLLKLAALKFGQNVS